MIPITAGILGAHAGRSLFYNFLSSLMYITGIALVYASLGYLSATSSMIFGGWLASHLLIAVIIAFFLYLAFSMFGFYEFTIPQFLSAHGIERKQGNLINSFVFGVVSGTIASPCLTPALALLLGIVAKQANALFGFLMLFCFALGMGILLLLIGTFSATITLLPRAGEWMNQIKSMFGFLILAMCVYFAQPFLSETIIWAGYTLVAWVATGYCLRNICISKLSLVLGIFSLLVALTLCGHTFKIMM
jgi:thiol:disulfide interchange protein DsbD